MQGHLCNLGIESELSTCISSSSSLPSTSVLDCICTNTLTFNWGLLQSRDTLESFRHSEDKDEHGAAAAEIMSTLLPKSTWSDVTWQKVPLDRGVSQSDHGTTVLMMLKDPLPPFSGNSCAPPQLLLINYHSDGPSQRPSWYPQRHTLLSAQTRPSKDNKNSYTGLQSNWKNYSSIKKVIMWALVLFCNVRSVH